MTKKEPKAFITNQTLDEAVDTILEGMGQMLKEERKFNTETFATKEDLKREASWLRDDINGPKGELADTVSRKEFNQLGLKVDRILAS